MFMKYYVHDGQKQSEAYTLEELRALSTLKSDTYIWHEGLNGWKPANELVELADLFTKPPTLPPPFASKETPKEQNPLPSVRKVNKPLFLLTTKMKVLIGVSIVLLLIAIKFAYPYLYEAATGEHYPIVESGNTESSSSDQEKERQEENDKKRERQKEIEEAEARGKDDEQRRIAEAQNAQQQARNNQVQQHKEWSKNNMGALVRLEIVSYEARRLGGIYNIRVRVYNDSDFPVDAIRGRVAYAKNNGEVLSFAPIFANNIPPKSWIYTDAPSSDRGTVLTSLELRGIKCSALNYEWGR